MLGFGGLGYGSEMPISMAKCYIPSKRILSVVIYAGVSQSRGS